MSENTMSTTMYETQPAVSELNKVPGFDPRRFLRRTVTELTNHEILYLDLKYKKLWFRMKYPKGRIEKIRLKVTEQIAIIEARVFFDKGDVNPVSSFVAQRNANGRPGAQYIEAAQNAAENQALIDAGFGLQFCDISQGSDIEPLDTGIPVNAAVEGIKAAARENVPRQTAAVSAAPPSAKANILSEPVTAAAEPPAEEGTHSVIEPAPELPEQDINEAPAAQPVRQTDETPQPQADVQESAAAQPDISDTPRSAAQAVLEIVGGGQQRDSAPEVPQASRYTADMSVDEIFAAMTPEEALAVVVDSGTCAGWTLAEVAEKRPASLKWYLNGYTGNNNALKAGSRLLLEMYAEKKAS